MSRSCLQVGDPALYALILSRSTLFRHHMMCIMIAGVRIWRGAVATSRGRSRMRKANIVLGHCGALACKSLVLVRLQLWPK